MMNGRPAILAEGLEKSYGKTRALDSLDLAVEEGTVLGLLGPNGAGKTTAVRILTTLLAPDAGRAEVVGLDVVKQADELRSRIGLTGQYAAVDEYLTGRENLEMVGRLYHLPKRGARKRADELLERFDLTDAASRLAKTYSGGMRRRLDLAASLVYRPPVLFLDEPTTGLDPRSRLAMWDIIGELVAGGTTLLLTTQYLDEADRRHARPPPRLRRPPAPHADHRRGAGPTPQPARRVRGLAGTRLVRGHTPDLRAALDFALPARCDTLTRAKPPYWVTHQGMLGSVATERRGTSTCSTRIHNVAGGSMSLTKDY